MNINCHGEEVILNTYLLNKSQKTKCLIRKINILLTPEEKVRQAFLQRFIDLGLTKDYHFRVEHKSYDIAIYQKFNMKDFNPSYPPLLIIEVKRNGIYVLEYLYQIKKYLKTANTRFGLLGNCKELYIINSNTGEKEIFKFTDVIGILSKEVENRDITRNIETFRLAQKGDFDAFEELTYKYDMESIFKFLIKDSFKEIENEGYLFEIKGNMIMFNNQGISPRKSGWRPRFNKRNFVRLVSIQNK